MSAPSGPARRVLFGTAIGAAVAGAVAIAITGLAEAGLVVAALVVALVIGARGIVLVTRRLLAPDEKRGRPGFAAAYPRSPELDRLVIAFGAGNFALVRRDAPRLADSAEDEAVRAAARDLRSRIAPDPTAVYLLAVGVALAIAVSVYYMTRPH